MDIHKVDRILNHAALHLTSSACTWKGDALLDVADFVRELEALIEEVIAEIKDGVDE